MAGRARIAVIGTGGTFAMHGRHRFDWVEYGDSGVVHPLATLLDSLGALAPDSDIVALTFRSLGSTGIVPQDWLELAQLIDRAVQDDPTLTGIVVTHGTATLEETAWFLQLALSLPIPVVVTGAQRPANTDGSDAAANLRAALAVAADPAARGLGTLVVMNGLVFSARDVTKAASFELGAFEAPMFGPLARVEADAGVTWRRRPVAAAADWSCAIAAIAALPRVDVAMSYAGADGAAIDAFVAAGAHAIVSAGLAPGRPANGERAALVAAVARGVIVVQSTRAARGTVPVQRFLTADGVLAGGDLAPHKLRILLMLALAQGADAQAIQHHILSA